MTDIASKTEPIIADNRDKMPTRPSSIATIHPQITKQLLLPMQPATMRIKTLNNHINTIYMYKQ